MKTNDFLFRMSLAVLRSCDIPSKWHASINAAREIRDPSLAVDSADRHKIASSRHPLKIVFDGARYRFGLMKSAALRELAIDRATAIHNADRYPTTKDSPMALRASEFVV